jgi:hypothetical protein
MCVCVRLRFVENKKLLKELSAYFHCIHPRSLNVHRFGMVEATKLKKYGFEVIFNIITSTHSFIKIHQSVKTLLGVSLHPPQKFQRPPFWNY